MHRTLPAAAAIAILTAWGLRPVAACQEFPPDPVIDLAVTGGAASSMTLGWSAPYDASWWGPEINYYELRYSTIPITDANFDSATNPASTYQLAAPLPRGFEYDYDGLPRTWPGKPQSATITGLTSGMTYYFAIKAVGHYLFISPLSPVVSARVHSDWTCPAPISTFQVTATTTQSATLSWRTTGDDDYAGIATMINVVYSTSPIDAGNFSQATIVSGVPLLPGGTTQVLEVSGLPSGFTYHFAIVAWDEDQNSSGIASAAGYVGEPLPDDGDGGKRGACSSAAAAGATLLLLVGLGGLVLVRR